MAEEIVGNVIVTYDPIDRKHTLTPELGLLNRDVQTMTWTLQGPPGIPLPSGVQFGYPGIVFHPPLPLPDGFTTWPGEDPTRVSDVQLRVWVNAVLDHGGPSQKYRYDIWIMNNGVHEKLTFFHADESVSNIKIDPDMENEPKP